MEREEDDPKERSDAVRHIADPTCKRVPELFSYGIQAVRTYDFDWCTNSG